MPAQEVLVAPTEAENPRRGLWQTSRDQAAERVGPREAAMVGMLAAPADAAAVSYTHLTLPTKAEV